MKKIVLIEDDHLLSENLAELLTENGYEVIPATNGKEGIKIVKSQIPDLVISDVVLPGSSGLEVKRTLNKDPLVSTIPFIFLSARSDIQDVRKGMELGADDYVIKPFTNEQLLSSIKIRLNKNEIFKKHNKELTKSIAFSLPHEFNNPLISILGYSEIIEDTCEKNKLENAEELIKYSRIINAAGKELLGLIKRFLLVIKLETIFSDPEEINKYNENGAKFSMSSYIKNFISKLSVEKYENRVIIQDNAENSLLKISEEDFEIVVSELIDNAFKFGIKNTEIFITESVEDKFYCLLIKNYGRGMTREQIAQIGLFQQFEREKYEQRGSGIGLVIAKKLVELNKGYLRIESLLKAETNVYIYIPLKEKLNEKHFIS
ncbi:MAG: hybrid sensor histidine kinase/response regulator [Melioribacteraceae bacterium]|nr:MAG: hybrid sensor histidine kinase/response regulator [Melioribacteraceae bacterium]